MTNYAPGIMADSDWARCKKLQKSNGNWGDVLKIDRSIILTLDDALVDLGKSCVITAGTAGTHINGSYHFPTDYRLGLALDFMLLETVRCELPDILLGLLRHNFTGIGIYSTWKLNFQAGAIGGFHVDTRPVEKKALWLKADQGYLPLNFQNLKTYFV